MGIYSALCINSIHRKKSVTPALEIKQPGPAS